MRQALGGFGLVAGATYPFRVLKVFWCNPKLLSYLAIPIFVNFVVAIGLYLGLLLPAWDIKEKLIANLDIWLDNLTQRLPGWLGILEYLIVPLGLLLHVLLILGLVVLTGFVLTQFGILLGAPWYGQLSEKLEKLRTGNLVIVEVNFVTDIWRAIIYELKKLVLMIFIGIPLLMAHLFPGVGTLIGTIGGTTLSATLVCLDFFDATLERRRLPFRQKLKIVFKSLPASASFSLVCLGLISIPFLNLLTIPLCVASGTLFVCDRVLPYLLINNAPNH